LICSSLFAYDKNLNFYFISAVDRRRSKEILENSNVSMSIVPHKFNCGDNVKGLQVEDMCEKLTGLNSGKAFSVICKKISKDCQAYYKR